MKRVLVLNYEFPPLGGGASPVSYELAKKLSETGDYDIDVVTMGYKDLPKYEEINSHMRVHRVKCWRSKKEICHPWEQATYLVSGYFKCRELLKKEKYDICHCHFIIPTGVLALRLKKEFNLPYVITSHGSDVPGYNSDRFKIIHKFTKPLLRLILNNAKGAYTGSKYLTDLANSIGSKTKYELIREGFDSSKFIPKEKKKMILSTGRLFPRKGFQYLIKAVMNENINWEVHIAGDGPMRSELEKLAQISKTKIIFHGWLDNKSKVYKDLLEQSAIYVLMSEKENSSVSLLEAMSAGCAMITTNVSGCPETVGDSGVTIQVRDPVQLLEAIKDVINRTTELGQKARFRILQEFDWNKNLINLVNKFNI